MSNEFEKLDAFMKKNAPPMPSANPLFSPRVDNTNWILRSAFVLTLVLVVLGTISKLQTAQDENTLALSEALSWDVTSDELPMDLEDTLAMVE